MRQDLLTKMSKYEQLRKKLQFGHKFCLKNHMYVARNIIMFNFEANYMLKKTNLCHKSNNRRFNIHPAPRPDKT